jgi:hypothetical protein
MPTGSCDQLADLVGRDVRQGQSDFLYRSVGEDGSRDGKGQDDAQYLSYVDVAKLLSDA